MHGNRVAIGALGAVILAIAAAVVFIRDHAAHGFIDANDRELVGRGAQLYAIHCAACHGAALEGQSDWRQPLPSGSLPAPPHDATGHTWHHPDEQLFDIVKRGLVPGETAPYGYVSDMPA